MPGTVPHADSQRFVYHRIMIADTSLAQVAALMAEPARSRMLCCLLDGHSRTATELASVGDVGASTASAHLAKLLAQGLLDCTAQGKHRYYRLANAEVARALEAMLVVAGPGPALQAKHTRGPARGAALL
jgi:DNA-binding transcriptional ArsR family regulator